MPGLPNKIFLIFLVEEVSLFFGELRMDVTEKKVHGKVLIFKEIGFLIQEVEKRFSLLKLIVLLERRLYL